MEKMTASAYPAPNAVIAAFADQKVKLPLRLSEDAGDMGETLK